VKAHLAKFLSWNFEEEIFKDDSAQLSLDGILAKFPTSKLAKNTRVLGSFLECIQSQPHLCKELGTLPSKRGKGRTKQVASAMAKTWSVLPDIFRNFVKDQNDIYPVRGDVVVIDDENPTQDDAKTFVMPYPRGHIRSVAAQFLVCDVGVEEWTCEEYVAAHLQLPLDASPFQIAQIVSAVIKHGSDTKLVVKVWCTHAQSEAVNRAMRMASAKHIRVQPHYWWEAKPGDENLNHNESPSFKPPDVEIGFVGYFTDLDNFGLFVGTNNGSSVVYAPRLPAARLSRVSPSGKTCATEMNVAVPKDFFVQHSMEGDWVADILCGSGSAAVAAVTTGRNCVVVDLDQDMVR
jgi:hypothetical protein